MNDSKRQLASDGKASEAGSGKARSVLNPQEDTHAEVSPADKGSPPVDVKSPASVPEATAEAQGESAASGGKGKAGSAGKNNDQKPAAAPEPEAKPAPSSKIAEEDGTSAGKKGQSKSNKAGQDPLDASVDEESVDVSWPGDDGEIPLVLEETATASSAGLSALSDLAISFPEEGGAVGSVQGGLNASASEDAGAAELDLLLMDDAGEPLLEMHSGASLSSGGSHASASIKLDNIEGDGARLVIFGFGSSDASGVYTSVDLF